MNESTVTPHTTRMALLHKSKRDGRAVPLRKAFVQLKQGRMSRPGPLAALVRSHGERPLDLFLLTLCLATGGQFTVSLEARVWARAIDLSPTGADMVSRYWRRLADLRLVARSKKGRSAELTLLREDGSGAVYTHPGKAKDAYFKLPFAYWEKGWDTRLSLPAKAMLLIALSRPDNFVMPEKQAAAWYGISEDTIGRGLAELRDKAVLHRTEERKSAPLSPLVGHLLRTSPFLTPEQWLRLMQVTH